MNEREAKRTWRIKARHGTSATGAADIRELTVLRRFVGASNAQNQRLKLSFRGLVVDKGKFRPDHARRSLLARAMVSPSILINPKLKGMPRAFEAGRLCFVGEQNAARLDCGITRAVAIVKPVPRNGTFQVEVQFGKQSTVLFSAPLHAARAAVMDLDDSARAGDNDGVVNITFAVASQSKAQVLSIPLRKKDINTCRMLLNLPTMQKQFRTAAQTADGGKPTEEAKLLRAIHRDLESVRSEGSSAAFATGLGDGWQAISVVDALRNMPGLRRAAAIVATTETTVAKRTPPLSLNSSGLSQHRSRYSFGMVRKRFKPIHPSAESMRGSKKQTKPPWFSRVGRNGSRASGMGLTRSHQLMTRTAN
jgi:hypothetical protein